MICSMHFLFFRARVYICMRFFFLYTLRMIEQSILEETSKEYLVQPFMGREACLRLSGALSNCNMKISRDEDSAGFLCSSH